VQLAGKIDWAWIDGEMAPLYSDKGVQASRAASRSASAAQAHVRAVHEGVCERWVYDRTSALHRRDVLPAHLPTRALDLSHWRKRLGDKLDLLLAESLRVAHESGALRTRDLARVTVDTTVQPRTCLPDRRQASPRGDQGLNAWLATTACGCGSPTCASPSRRDDGGALCHAKHSTATIEKCASCAPGWVADPRHPPQDRRPRARRGGLRGPLSRASQIRSQRQRQRG